MHLERLEESNFTISFRLWNIVDNFVSVFTGIYGPTGSTNRELLWEELGVVGGFLVPRGGF